VSSFNIASWLVLLLGLAGVVGGSVWLRSAGHRRVATAITLLLAIPGLLFASFFVVVLITNPRWN
jgi:4-amino-4-deoxy-L-arabinose transferase-like glycosyltransferase